MDMKEVASIFIGGMCSINVFTNNPNNKSGHFPETCDHFPGNSVN